MSGQTPHNNPTSQKNRLAVQAIQTRRRDAGMHGSKGTQEAMCKILRGRHGQKEEKQIDTGKKRALRMPGPRLGGRGSQSRRYHSRYTLYLFAHANNGNAESDV